MATKKVNLNGNTIMDITDTTAVASDVAQGKYFYDADGVKTVGTASGGGGDGSISLNTYVNNGGKFAYYSGETIDLTGIDTSEIEEMDSMFLWCYGLTSLNLSGFNTSNATDMSAMFSDCESLETLNLSNFDTSNVTNMYSMFNCCYSLTSLNLSNFNTGNVSDFSEMFNDCKSLETLDIRNFDFSSSSATPGSMFTGVPSTCVIYVNQAGYNWIADRYNNYSNDIDLASLSMLQVVSNS